jgi:ABC-type transport system involved in cytochrome c biogenesis permease subunit
MDPTLLSLEGIAGTAAIFLTLAASALSWLRAGTGKEPFGLVASASAALALAALIASAAARTILSGHLPFASMYEFGLLVAMAMLVAHFALEAAGKRFGPITLPMAFLAVATNSLLFGEATPLMPALKSWWLAAHVLTAVVAYGLLGVSFALSLAYFAAPKLRALPDAESLYKTADFLIALAFPFLTLLIATGAVWAEYAWGAWWSWDPKETWALVTWLVYLGYLHGSRVRKMKPRAAMLFCAIAFAVVLFTYFGVNFLLSGLHSYVG